MYDPKHLITQFLTENFCNYLCNWSAPNTVHYDKIVGKDKPFLLIFHIGTCRRRTLLQIYKDARSFWEIPLRSHNRVRVFLAAESNVKNVISFQLCLFCSATFTDLNVEALGVMFKQHQALVIIERINLYV